MDDTLIEKPQKLLKFIAEKFITHCGKYSGLFKRSDFNRQFDRFLSVMKTGFSKNRIV